MKLITLWLKDGESIKLNLNHIVYISQDKYLEIANVRITNGDRLIIDSDEYAKLCHLIEEYEDG